MSAPLVELFTAGTLVAALSNVASGFIDVRAYDSLRIGATVTAGTYVFEIDWSRDGVAADFTEAVVVANNTSISKPVAGKFAKIRVKNTHTLDAFTAHRTVVNGIPAAK